MSELLRLAAHLRRSSDAELAQLLAERMIASSAIVDFIDLAEALLSPRNLAATLTSLTQSEVLALRTIAGGGSPEAAPAARLAHKCLVDDGDGKLTIYPSVSAALEQLAHWNKPKLIDLEPSNLDAAAAGLAGPAGIQAFETSQALTELCLDLEQRWVREVNKRNVGLPDIKRLANHLRKSNEFARSIYELADLLGLMVLQNGRWSIGSAAEHWIGTDTKQRWMMLARTWRASLGDHGSGELLAALSQAGSTGLSLELLLEQTYPLADSAVESHIHRLVKYAELMGLAVHERVTPWFAAVLKAEFESAASAVAEYLPSTQRTLICQSDLSLIAPGPLPTQVEILLRRFVETEQVGMASTYRMSALSLSRGLETGLSIDEIRDLLLELSAKQLPQPITYLLDEVQRRFASLRVQPAKPDNPEGIASVIRAEDHVLLTTLLRDQNLKPLALRQIEPPALVCRYEPEVVYYQLREHGYVAVMVDPSGKVLSPLAHLERSNPTLASSTAAADVARLREQDRKVLTEPETDDVIRQIQLSLKNKTRLQVVVLNSAGEEIEFLLEPIGLANNRLRAKDKKADIERTLPLSSIKRVSLG